MTPYNFDHIREKAGEEIAEYFTRVIEGWALAVGKGRVGRIRYALHQMNQRAYLGGKLAAMRDAGEQLKATMDPLRRRIEELEMILRQSVSKIDAEEARQQAALGMRNKASYLAEERDGSPNVLSEAIDNIPMPKTMWTETVRPHDHGHHGHK